MTCMYTCICRIGPAWKFLEGTPIACDMRARKISLKLNMWHFQFSIWLKCCVHLEFCWKPQLNQTSGSKVIEGFSVQRCSFLFLAISHIPFSGYISQSMLPMFDWFSKIITQFTMHPNFSCTKVLFLTKHPKERIESLLKLICDKYIMPILQYIGNLMLVN